jgi:putative DNA primase/helicase
MPAQGPPPGRESLVKRVRSYLAAVPPAVSGERGHNRTFYAACQAIHGFGLTIQEALPLLREWNQKCRPQWTEKELLHKLEDAFKKAGPRGYLVGEGNDGELPDDPYRLARSFLQDRVWAYWRQSFWRYDGRRYVEVPDDEAEGSLSRHIKEEFDRVYRTEVARYEEKSRQSEEGDKENGRNGGRPARPPLLRKVTSVVVTNVLKAVRSLIILPRPFEQPCWLPEPVKPEAMGREDCPAGNVLAHEAGILDLDTGEESAHTPRWFSPVCLPYRYDPAATAPQWEAVLQRNLEGDAERIALLQEWFGYCLARTTDAQRFLILAGEGGNGKSVILAALQAVLGSENVSNVPLEGLAAR